MEQTIDTLILGELIHYGEKRFIPSKFRPIMNSAWIKPSGGLWTSPVNSSCGWKDWCIGEEFGRFNESTFFTISLAPDTKILIIDSLEDLVNAPLTDIYGNRKSLDFECLVSMGYGAIWLTEKGLNETHLSYPIGLYGWDCESVLILNPDCIVC